MPALHLILCDNALPVVDAWNAYFPNLPDVEIVCDDLASVPADALLLPVNSFGSLDGGGLDAPLVELLGDDTQAEVFGLVRVGWGGEMPVGVAEVLVAPDGPFSILVVAPVLRVMQNVGRTVNSYLAFRAALRAVLQFNSEHGDIISSLLVPGLGTFSGQMPPLRAARQMRAAYNAVLLNAPPNVDISLDAGADSDDKFVVRAGEAQA